MNEESTRVILESIDKYVKGKLGPTEIDRLWAQLLEHPKFYTLLKTEAGLKKLYKQKSLEQSRKKKKSIKIPAKNTIIIVLAAVILLFIFFNLFRSGMQSEVSPELTSINVMNLVSPDVTRTSSDPLSLADQKMQQAFVHALSNDSDEAIATYRELLESEVAVNENAVNYNLAILYFNRGDYGASAKAFENVECAVVDRSVNIAACYWFKANSYLAGGDLEKAKDMVNKTIQMNGLYSDEARYLLLRMED